MMNDVKWRYQDEEDSFLRGDGQLNMILAVWQQLYLKVILDALFSR